MDVHHVSRLVVGHRQVGSDLRIETHVGEGVLRCEMRSRQVVVPVRHEHLGSLRAGQHLAHVLRGIHIGTLEVLVIPLLPDVHLEDAVDLLRVEPDLLPQIVVESRRGHRHGGITRGIRLDDVPGADAVDPEGRATRSVVLHGPRQALTEAMSEADLVVLVLDGTRDPDPSERGALEEAASDVERTVVVVNKVDRPDARLDEVVDEVYQLFFDLDAADEHIEFQIVSTVAREGRAMPGIGVPDQDADLSPLLDAIVTTIPAPAGDSEAPLQALVTNLDASDYLGRLAIGRVVQGTLRGGTQIALCHSNEEEPPLRRKLTHLLGFSGLQRYEVEDRVAGDLFVVAGFPEVEIGDTLADPVDPQPLPRLVVDEPVLRMTLGMSMVGSTTMSARMCRQR